MKKPNDHAEPTLKKTEEKKTEKKLANTLSTNPINGGEGLVCTIFLLVLVILSWSGLFKRWFELLFKRHFIWVIVINFVQMIDMYLCLIFSCSYCKTYIHVMTVF